MFIYTEEAKRLKFEDLKKIRSNSYNALYYYLKKTIKSEKNKNIDYLIVEAINYEYYFTTDRFEDDPEDDFETQAFRIIYVFKDNSFCNSYKGIFYRENKDGSFNSQIGYIGRPSFEDDKEKQSTMALIKKIKTSITF